MQSFSVTKRSAYTSNSDLEAFADSEREAANQPLSGGPFKAVLEALHKIQSAYPIADNPIRTALVTARGAPAHKRVVLTLTGVGHPDRRGPVSRRPIKR